MKIKNYISVLGVSALLAGGLSSCDDFLSTLPDSRAEIDTYEDIRSLLISAYPINGYNLVAELSSDNVVHNLEAASLSTLFYDQVYSWADVNEGNNESPRRVWEGAYSAIQTANAALEAIDKLGNTAELRALRGEALLCRAYGHYILTQLFAEAYNKATAESKLGVPYMTKPETTLNPKYQRESLASNYAKIAADIEEGMPLLSDAIYKAPKYHFNKRAANAFAARFYLYYQQWDKAMSYAQALLGSNPSNQLRDYAQILALPGGQGGFGNRTLEWIDHSNPNNLLLLTSYSSLGRYFGYSVEGSRYTHSSFISRSQTTESPNAWGSTSLKLEPDELTDPYRKIIMPKVPSQFEITERIQGTGYRRTTYVEFSTDETLLVRAEAAIMLGQFDIALRDMNLYLSNTYSSFTPLSDATITSWNGEVEYSTPTAPTARKRLNPQWQISEQQEKYLHVLLHLRRIETLHTGLRWFDIKRYGIEVTRVDVVAGVTPRATANVLGKDDPRRALQIPEEAIAAGMTPNRQ